MLLRCKDLRSEIGEIPNRWRVLFTTLEGREDPRVVAAVYSRGHGLTSAARNLATLSISERDLEALARTAMSEVGHFARYGDATLKGAVEAVVDTIINRSVHPSYPHTH